MSRKRRKPSSTCVEEGFVAMMYAQKWAYFFD
jgi:hypothetical protein